MVSSVPASPYIECKPYFGSKTCFRASLISLRMILAQLFFARVTSYPFKNALRVLALSVIGVVSSRPCS